MRHSPPCIPSALALLSLRQIQSLVACCGDVKLWKYFFEEPTRTHLQSIVNKVAQDFQLCATLVGVGRLAK